MPDFDDAALLANAAELTKAYNQLQRAKGSAASTSLYAPGASAGETMQKSVTGGVFSEAIIARGTDADARRAEADRVANMPVQRALVRANLAKAAKAAGVAVPVYTDAALDAAIHAAAR